ncbi:MAG: serine hydrolase domain-containing protein [Myxococcota bacterium]
MTRTRALTSPLLLLLTLTACGATEGPPLDATTSTEALLTHPEVGTWCSAIWPNTGWTFVWDSAQDATVCAGASGVDVRRTGNFLTSGWNTVEVRCAPNYFWLYVGWGAQALQWAFDAAAQTQTGGRCEFFVTMGSTPRTDPDSPSGACTGATSQSFGQLVDATGATHKLVGCAGHVKWSDRATLCGWGWKPASAATWAAHTPSMAVAHNYWTDDNLYYRGPATSCAVSAVSVSGFSACSADDPMRVCTPSGSDPEGNQCNWTGCRLGSSSNATFGGCVNNEFAGTLCERVAEAPPPPAPSYPLDVPALHQSVLSQLDAGVGGYQLVTLDASGGVALRHVGGRASSFPTPMTATQRMSGASMAKAITGTALLAVLEDLQRRGFRVDADSTIAAYLPSTWTVPARSGAITFRQLAAHGAGFSREQCNAEDLQGVRAMVEAGPALATGTIDYHGCNYALLRVLIAYLVEGPTAWRPFEGDPTTLGRLTAESYRNYVRGKVLTPAGLPFLEEFYADATTPTQYFRPDGSICSGITNEQSVERGGPGFWVYTATEYARFQQALWSGKILGPAALAELRLRASVPYEFGVMRWVEPYGSSYEHGGGGGGGCGPSSIWVTHPNGYTTVLMSNAGDVAVASQAPLRNAFNAAFHP